MRGACRFACAGPSPCSTPRVPAPEPTLRARFEEPSLHLGRTMALQQLGRFDPTATASPDAFTKVYLDDESRVVRHHLRRVGTAIEIEVTGHADADADALRAWQEQLALDDGLRSFRPAHPELRRLLAALPGLRILRVPWRFDVAAGAILQQRVSFGEAAQGFRRIAVAMGTTTPLGLAFPSARRLAETPAFALQALGVDAPRARALVSLAREHARHGLLTAACGLETLRRRLAALPGIGPWTTEMILGFALGDTDALPLGDLHLPSLVCRTLAGEPHGTDARMIELLEPYRGQRFRVVRLLWAAVFHDPPLLRRSTPRARR